MYTMRYIQIEISCIQILLHKKSTKPFRPKAENSFQCHIHHSDLSAKLQVRIN